MIGIYNTWAGHDAEKCASLSGGGTVVTQGRQVVAEGDPVERAAFWSGVWAGVAWSTAFAAGLYVGLSLVMALY